MKERIEQIVAKKRKELAILEQQLEDIEVAPYKKWEDKYIQLTDIMVARVDRVLFVSTDQTASFEGLTVFADTGTMQIVWDDYNSFDIDKEPAEITKEQFIEFAEKGLEAFKHEFAKDGESE